MQEHFDSRRLRKAGANVKEWFARFPPRRGVERDSSADDVDPLISKMVGYFSSELLEVAVRAAVEVDAERVSRAKADAGGEPAGLATAV